MSFLSNLFSWAKNSGVLASAEKAAAAEVSALIEQATNKALEHAPDMAPAITAASQNLLMAALSGLATKAK